MFPNQLQIQTPTPVLDYQKELQRKSHRRDLQEIYPTQKRYQITNLKSVFSKVALPVANIMIQAGRQLKERYQTA